MNTLKYITIAFSMLLLVGCETRKDVFHQYNATPQVFLNTTRDFSEKKNNVSIQLRHGQQQTVYFDYTDDYVEAGIQVDYMIVSETPLPEYINCYLDRDSRRVIIKDVLPPSTINDKILNFSIKIIVSDYYGDKGEAIINIADYDNLPPEPVISFSQIQNMEYKIDASASTDVDGDKIVAYEYLIDGETMTTESGYENLSEHKCLFNPGMAGKGGTYIISTTLNSVKHAFQTSGTHTVCVRVKDSLGLWSSWKSTTIDVQ